MLRYTASFYSNRFKHPIFAAILSASVLFYVIALVVDLTAPFTLPLINTGVPPIAAGFFGVFGTLAAAIGVLAYVVLFVSKGISIIRDRAAPHRA